jgi:flagellar hook-associated protein 2
VRDAINQANAGVGASIVNDGTGARLVLTANSTGAANTISLTVADADGNGADMAGLSRLASVNMEQATAAGDARVEINGLTVTGASNTLDQAIEGLSLELKGTTEVGSPVTVDVGQDRAAVRTAVEGFITAYNSVITQIADLTRYNPETREAGLLLGDSTVRGIRSRLSSALTQTGGSADGLFNNLVNLGIRSDETGALSLASGSLEQALDQDFAGTVDLLNDVAGGLQNAVRGFTESGGLLDNRADGLRGNIRDIDRQRETLNLRMEQMEARLVRQFGALDALVGQLQTTSEFLDQQLSNLNSLFQDQRRR